MRLVYDSLTRTPASFTEDLRARPHSGDMNKSTLFRTAATIATLAGLAVLIVAVRAFVAVRTIPAIADTLAHALTFPS